MRYSVLRTHFSSPFNLSIFRGSVYFHPYFRNNRSRLPWNGFSALEYRSVFQIAQESAGGSLLWTLKLRYNRHFHRIISSSFYSGFPRTADTFSSPWFPRWARCKRKSCAFVRFYCLSILFTGWVLRLCIRTVVRERLREKEFRERDNWVRERIQRVRELRERESLER